jgi:hypothetical protein
MPDNLITKEVLKRKLLLLFPHYGPSAHLTETSNAIHSLPAEQ